MNAALSQGTTDTNENDDMNMGSQSEHTEPVLESEERQAAVCEDHTVLAHDAASGAVWGQWWHIYGCSPLTLCRLELLMACHGPHT